MSTPRLVVVALAGIFLLGCEGEPDPLTPRIASTTDPERAAIEPVTCEGDYDLETQSDVDGFPDCEIVTGYVRVETVEGTSDPVVNLDALAGLTRVGDYLAVYRNPALESTAGLSGLTEVGRFFLVRENPALVRLTGFGSLRSVSAFFTIRDNTSLTEIEPFSALETVGRYVRIMGNDALEHPGRFPVLRRVGEDLSFLGNGSLRTIDGFPALVDLGTSDIGTRGLYVEGNPLLEGIAGFPALTATVGSVVVKANPTLAHVDGLWSLVFVGGDLTVVDNASLDECAWGLSGLLMGGDVDGTIEIHGNAGGCVDMEAVLARLRSPAFALAVVTARVRDLASTGAIRPGHARALSNKLEGAARQLEKGNVRPALAMVLAVSHQVTELRDDGQLSTEVAERIIGWAEQIADALGALL